MAESFAADARRPSRNLIVCCDGTNNQFGPENTNIVRLVQVLDRNPFKQRIYYDPGLGTLPEPGTWGKISQWISKVAGLAFGAGINWKVQEAYTFLLNTWEPGDKVFLFGFSRGAYTVRVLGGILLQPTAGRLDDYAYFFPIAFLLAAHRAFISCESRFLPAAVIPPFLFVVETSAFLPFLLAHRALIAAAIFARA